MLDKHELAFAMEVISKKPAGHYMVRELFGDLWQTNRRPRHYARQFKAAVLRGDLAGVRLAGKKSNNCLLYQVGTASHPCDVGALGAGSRTGSRSPGRVGS